ncbi:uncharacterized protein LOC122540632 [Chiloscyllium plagiosum]|uniref:uncharacterized protein LOC122540632 n=1 Tax=Chiloscyllium plagiosum TaxID=36176 RepID=UPI001CB8779F|nr:uncharacterized protein LOC122540632 [Chiloscyllium plagiosum]XP_043532541.1 uncharacterized protein LOC122540632 [Chiloscyllium plagiosum]XP_043532542.1 uncharacterized protein LOC122540632 [Chiloscyllium plagiosum]
MKMLTVTLMLLVVKGIQGNVIPQNETELSEPVSRPQPLWDLFNIRSEIVTRAIEGLSQSDIGKSIQAKIAGIDGILEDWVVSSTKQLSTLAKELTWKEEPLIDKVLNQTILVWKKLAFVDEELHGVIGQEGYATIHEKLEKLQEILHHSNVTQRLTTNNLDQLYQSAAHHLERSYNLTAPYSGKIVQKLQDLVSLVHNATEELKTW